MGGTFLRAAAAACVLFLQCALAQSALAQSALAQSGARAGQPTELPVATNPAQQPRAAYAPLAVFDPLVGRTWRGEGRNERGEPVTDIVRWDFILGGRAVQSTHSVNGGIYGGRTIIFYDEGARKYVFHYFTTAGFHTLGELAPTAEGFTLVQQVLGNPNVREVRSEFTFGPSSYTARSVMLTTAGEQTPGPSFTYLLAPNTQVVIGGAVQ